MRRRQILQERGPEPPPIRVVWATPTYYTLPGHCPKCGEHVGRAVRLHVETCEGKPVDGD